MTHRAHPGKPATSPSTVQRAAARAALAQALTALPDYPHPIQMVALDIDGTLLRSDKRVTRHTALALQAAGERGVRVVLATARPPRSVKPILQSLKLDGWHIHYNGALIHDFTRRRNIHHQPLDLDLAQQIIKAARATDPQVVVSIEILDKWYTDHLDNTLPTQTSIAFMPDYIGPLEAILRTPVTKLMLLAPPERLEPIRRTIARKFAGKVMLAISDAHLLQVIHPRADKAHALARIAQHYHIKPAHVLAIGDAPNDIGMLRWAGLGCAMGNAWDEVRPHAKVLLPTNDQDGVAIAVRRYVLGEKGKTTPKPTA